MSQGAEHLDGCRFSRAVRAEEGEDLTLGHREVDLAHGGQVAVAFGELVDINCQRPLDVLMELRALQRDVAHLPSPPGCCMRSTVRFMLLPVLDPIPVDLGVISREPVGPIVPTLPTYKGWTPADERFAVALDRQDIGAVLLSACRRGDGPAGREPKRVRWPLN